MRNFWYRGLAIVGVLLVLCLIVSGALYVQENRNGSPNENAPTPTATPTPTEEPTETPTDEPPTCTTWATAPSDYTNNRWFADGIAEIRNATTDAEAIAAAHAWLAEVRKDPSLLAGTTKYLLHRDVDVATLSTDACATEAAVQLVTELELALSMGTVVAEEAPANGFNSGVNDGVVIGSTTPGVSGDRSAIKITLPDGTVVWVMARCGQIVTPGTPPVPPGTTDDTCPPETPDGKWPVCKDDATVSDPESRGNNKSGGAGKSPEQPDAVGPPAEGTPPVVYNPPPAAPPVVTPPVESTPDPAPAPSPEPQAPTPEAPSTGTSCAPGITRC